MKKFLSVIIFTLFFFLSAISIVKAENIADSSAPLSYQSSEIGDIIEKQNKQKLQIVIKNVLTKYNSPMADESDAFVDACLKYKIDCYLLPSIAGLESTFGKFVWPDSHNAFGWARGYMMFDSWTIGIDTVARGLRKGYLNKGALSVEEIGPIYSESPTWAVRVNYFIRQFEKEEAKLTLFSSQFPVQL